MTPERLAAELFGVDIEHITQAPKFCGIGYDGDCLAGECQILMAVETLRPILIALREAQGEVRRLRECRTCGGLPHPSGKVCICGGTNFVEEELRQIRLALFATEEERDTLQRRMAALEKAVECYLASDRGDLAERQLYAALRGEEAR